MKLVTFETFAQSDEKISLNQLKDKDKDRQRQRAIGDTCDIEKIYEYDLQTLPEAQRTQGIDSIS